MQIYKKIFRVYICVRFILSLSCQGYTAHILHYMSFMTRYYINVLKISTLVRQMYVNLTAFSFSFFTAMLYLLLSIYLVIYHYFQVNCSSDFANCMPPIPLQPHCTRPTTLSIPLLCKSLMQILTRLTKHFKHKHKKVIVIKNSSSQWHSTAVSRSGWDFCHHNQSLFINKITSREKYGNVSPEDLILNTNLSLVHCHFFN